jgi:hypothetical protein
MANGKRKCLSDCSMDAIRRSIEDGRMMLGAGVMARIE